MLLNENKQMEELHVCWHSARLSGILALKAEVGARFIVPEENEFKIWDIIVFSRQPKKYQSTWKGYELIPKISKRNFQFGRLCYIFWSLLALISRWFRSQTFFSLLVAGKKRCNWQCFLPKVYSNSCLVQKGMIWSIWRRSDYVMQESII